MKQTKTILLLIFVALFALAACGSPAEEPTAVPEPTEEPAPEPTAEPVEEPVAEPTQAPADDMADDALMTDVVWMWSEYQDNGEVNDITVDNPENYTITFMEDGNAPIKADCNNILATYTQDGSSLTLILGPTTQVFCGEESLDTKYVQMLGDVVSFVMDGHDLVLNLKADAGNMIFVKGDGMMDDMGGEASVTGTATYLQRIALQDDAVLTVQIQDVSLADAAATVMGEDSYATEGAQVPLPFEVSYDPTMIEDNHDYALSVRITDADDNLLYINDTRIPVITKGNPTQDVEAMVIPVEGSADAGNSDLRTDNLEGETITFYHFGDLSGPYAAVTGPLIHGMEDAVAEINANGGIRGATVEIQFADDGGSVDEAVAIYDRYTSEDDNILIMFTYGSGEAEALASRFAEDEIPTLTSGLSSVAFYGEGSGYTFGLGPIYPDQFGAFLDYAIANWDDIKPASAGDEIKLAYLSWPGAFGQGALTDETRAYAEELGVEIVIEEIYDLAPTADTTTALLNAQAAGANVIWTNTLAFGPAALMNGIGALGLQDEFVLAGDNWAMDLGTYAFVSDPALAVGMYAPLSYLWWNDVEHPGVQQVEAMFAANERGVGDHGVGYILLAAGVDVAKQAIENAIDTVGFDALTGVDVQRALTDMGPYEGLEGIVSFDYSDGSRSPHSVQIRQIQGGPDAFNVVQDWTDTPDLRPTE